MNSPVKVFGQGLNKEFGYNNGYEQSVTALLVTNEFSYVAVQESSPFLYSTFPSYLLKVDTNGIMLWKIPINFESSDTDINQVKKIEEIPNLGVLIFINAREGCDIQNECYSQIQMINHSGETLWRREWGNTHDNCYFNDFSYDPIGFIRVNNNLQEESRIYTISLDGEFIDSLSISSKSLDGILSTSSHPTLAVYSDSLSIIDGNGTFTQTVSFTADINAAKTINDTVYILAGAKVYQLSANLNAIADYEYQGYGELKDIKKLNNNLVIKSETPDKIFLLHLNNSMNVQFVDSFNVENTFTGNNYGQTIVFSDFSETHLAIAQFHSLHHFESVRYRDYSLNDLNNSIVNRADASPVAIRILGYEITDWSTNPFDPSSVSITADVCVKNVGTSIIESVIINNKTLQNVACGYSVYYNEFDSLNIAPGDSAWLSCGVIYDRWHFLPPNPGDTIRFLLCVYTSNPNDIVDLNVSNDYTCDFSVLGFVGLNEIEQSSKKRQLVKVVDILGREHPIVSNKILFKLYNNGDVEKFMQLE